MDHFSAGKQAIDAQNLERAAIELRASLEVVDSPNARLELARVLRDSDKASEAWVEYGRTIETATRLAAREERYAKTAEAATSERNDLEAKLALVTVTVPNAPPGATLKVGGRQVPQDQWSAPNVATPGAVDVVLADATGKELARQTVSAVVGQKTLVTLDARPTEGTAAPAAAASTSGPGAKATKASADSGDDRPSAIDDSASADLAGSSSSDKTGLRPWAYAAGGVGIAGMAAFAVFGLLSNSTYDDLKTACPASRGGCPPGKSSEINRGQSEQTVANVGLVAGLVGLAAGTTLLVISLNSRPAPVTTGIVVGPGFVGVKGAL
jgi:hypothetical protein